MNKRGHGEGSFRQRANGTWEARITLPNGQRRSVYGATKKECQAKAKDALKAFEAGLVTLGRAQTVETYLRRWLEDAAKPTVRPKTWVNYESTVRLHVFPSIGQVKLTNLNAQHLQGVYSAMLASGKSKRTAQLAHAILHKALKQAVLWGLIPYSPADRVVSPKPRRREFSTLSAEQVSQLIAAADETQWRTLLTVAVSTGMRQGELLGLTWQDLDLEGRTLSVRRSLQFITGQGLVLTDVKTNHSRRTVALTQRAKAALKAQKASQNEARLRAGPAWEDRGLVFTTEAGRPLGQGSVTKRFQRDLRLLSLPVLRFHDLRHTAATLMLQAGVHPKVVQEMLGHVNIGVTMDTYSHVLENMQRDAADAMDRILNVGGLPSWDEVVIPENEAATVESWIP